MARRPGATGGCKTESVSTDAKDSEAFRLCFLINKELESVRRKRLPFALGPGLQTNGRAGRHTLVESPRLQTLSEDCYYCCFFVFLFDNGVPRFDLAGRLHVVVEIAVSLLFQQVSLAWSLPTCCTKAVVRPTLSMSGGFPL